MSIRQTIARCGGVARTKQLLDFHTAPEIRRGVRNGEIYRLCKGVYSLDPSAPKAIAAAHGGSLSCISLLREREVWILSDDSRLHVEFGPRGRLHRHGVQPLRPHYSGDHSYLKEVDVATALVSAASCLDAEAFFAAYESA